MSSTVEDSGVASRMGSYGNRREKAVRLWVEIPEDGGDIEAVNKQRSASGTIGVLKQMKKLYTARVGLRADEDEEDAERRTYGTYKICVIGVCG